jgi:hypothetical protein
VRYRQGDLEGTPGRLREPTRSPDRRSTGRVTVQYPGVAAAVRADLQNLGLLVRAAGRIAPGLDAKAVAEELRERLGEDGALHARA